MLVLILVCLPIVLAFAVFAINVAWMQLTRTELRTATDSAARAGSRMLSRSQDTAVARAAAVDAASRNTIAGQPLILATNDLQFGYSSEGDTGRWEFEVRDDSDRDINSVRVTGDRTEGSASGAVPMLFAGLFDRTTFEPMKTATASQIDRDVILVLDRSGSMDSPTPGGNRWEDLKRAVDAFLTALESTPQDELVGIVTYSSSASRDEELTMDYAQLMATIESRRVSGMTAIGRGLQAGRQAVMDRNYSRPTAKKTIVLMTDGNHNTGLRPDSIAQSAYEDDGITVHTITFSSGANQNHMRQVAALGGGQHWHADNQESLIAVFEEVANNLPTLLTE
jgi:uncharacterized protein YegL